MTVLVAYHSHTGTTRRVAELAAREIGADIVEIRTSRYGRGAGGFLRAAFDSIRGRLPEIDGGNLDPGRYDLVLLMAPVWAGRASTPIRAYLQQHRGKIRRSVFVLSCGGSAGQGAFDQMARLGGLCAEGTFAVRESDFKASGQLPAPLATYLASLKLLEPILHPLIGTVRSTEIASGESLHRTAIASTPATLAASKAAP